MSGRESHPPGLIGSLRTLAASLVALLHTRLELLGTELQEELARLVVALLYSFGALLFAALGIGFFGIAVVFGVDEGHRVLAAAVLAAIFLAVGSLGAWAVRRLVFERLRIFNASLTELDRDFAVLKGEPPPAPGQTDAQKTR
jgi:uncharacterized membrane protein YqjE